MTLFASTWTNLKFHAVVWQNFMSVTFILSQQYELRNLCFAVSCRHFLFQFDWVVFIFLRWCRFNIVYRDDFYRWLWLRLVGRGTGQVCWRFVFPLTLLFITAVVGWIVKLTWNSRNVNINYVNGILSGFSCISGKLQRLLINPMRPSVFWGNETLGCW